MLVLQKNVLSTRINSYEITPMLRVSYTVFLSWQSFLTRFFAHPFFSLFLSFVHPSLKFYTILGKGYSNNEHPSTRTPFNTIQQI